MNTINLEDRDLRQRQIAPPEKLSQCSATVIGVGAIGRQVAQQLAAMGIPKLQLIDPQVVEPVNLAAQAYMEEDLGHAKVLRTGAACRRLYSGVEVEMLTQKYSRSITTGNAVFCCVDSIAIRRAIWNGVEPTATFFTDGRMSAEALRVLTAADFSTRAHYPTTLFRQSEAYRGACTAKSTIFCANVAAGIMLEQFARWLRDIPVDADLQLNLLTSELTVVDPIG